MLAQDWAHTAHNAERNDANVRDRETPLRLQTSSAIHTVDVAVPVKSPKKHSSTLHKRRLPCTKKSLRDTPKLTDTRPSYFLRERNNNNDNHKFRRQLIHLCDPSIIDNIYVSSPLRTTIQTN